MKILFASEIVGKAGVFAVKNSLSDLKKDRGIDFVIANCNGTTGGFGCGKNHSIYLHKLGINVLTSGECIYYKRDMVPHLAHASYILRPANYPAGNPGRGWGVYHYGDGDNGKVGVINVMGLSGFERTHLNNPFTYVPEIVKRLKEQTKIIIVNFHALPTAEKRTMVFHLDGMVSAVIGTGTRVMTADAAVSAEGTASITDSGRTGSFISVAGLAKKQEIEKYLNQVPLRSEDAWDDIRLQGQILEIDPESGKCLSIESIQHLCPRSQDETNSQDNETDE